MCCAFDSLLSLGSAEFVVEAGDHLSGDMYVVIVVVSGAAGHHCMCLHV